jgi:23S rRNA pseudouridine2605 synthase
LFATDTQTASEVASEMAEWPSQFRIRVNGPVPDSRLSELPKNYPLVIQATCDSRNGANAWVTLKLAKGDPADALEICDALGLTVSRMIRTSLGDISLGDLVPGAFAPAV